MKNIGFELIVWLQSKGRQTFTLQEAVAHFNLSHKSVLEILGRLRRSNQIITLTDGLYSLVHPSEREHGIRPLHVINAVMNYCQLPYYVALLSAADFWGAAHHKPQVLQVIVSEQRMLRRLKDLRIELHVQKHFSKKGIIEKTNETGLFSISSVELTALDVITYESACGGFSNVCLIIDDLKPKIDMEKMIAIAKEYPFFSSVQRLGFILEAFSEKEEFESFQELKGWVIKQKPSLTSLLPSNPRGGEVHHDWKIVKNVKMELEP